MTVNLLATMAGARLPFRAIPCGRTREGGLRAGCRLPRRPLRPAAAAPRALGAGALRARDRRVFRRTGRARGVDARLARLRDRLRGLAGGDRAAAGADARLRRAADPR